jgi:hypothetical protein
MVGVDKLRRVIKAKGSCKWRRQIVINLWNEWIIIVTITYPPRIHTSDQLWTGYEDMDERIFLKSRTVFENHSGLCVCVGDEEIWQLTRLYGYDTHIWRRFIESFTQVSCFMFIFVSSVPFMMTHSSHIILRVWELLEIRLYKVYLEPIIESRAALATCTRYMFGK